ncbi:hypothetical protein J2W97_004233 [Paenibacillus jamilae]|uniref:hypothetical protein n=1 Tax=Paenibacillus TaxID=44249 RepID=UPI000D31DF46|nr:MULTISPECIES: hypothetical protein [Paenibacillus]MDP9678203.1 hypothetical protein [Paenibacillus jamilae]KAF6614391.1 hypothetical protein HFE00_24985 [Paenibacillus sp. EKM101P]KAF6616632.1 hypothetical protein HFE03_25555 [Paenibacillus sp. EKM102P]KAF6625509.1 hypothetical protein HFE01_24720 [Paenibacillus sp. EKM10P]KAF6641747.1 hypothetical protein HFE02_24595 [Paenibacillus sp. EKM11P]
MKIAKKSLYLGKPDIGCYPIHANMTSILSNHPSYKNWLFTNYMQLRLDLYQASDSSIAEEYYMEFYQPLMREYHPLLNIHSLSRKIIHITDINILDFLIKSVQCGNYIYALIDRQFISEYNMKESSMHDLFIYGYDLDKKVFYIADYFSSPFPTYKHCKATFDEIEKAFKEKINYSDDLWDDIFGIQIISLNKWKKYEFNLEYFMQSLNDYINSTNTARKFELIEGIPAKMPELQLHGSLDPKFGMSIYDRLCDLADFNPQFLRAMHILYEHKVCMTKRVAFFGEIGLLDGDLYMNYFIEIEKRAETLRNYIIKQILKNNNSKRKKMISMITELASLELECLGKLSLALK